MKESERGEASSSAAIPQVRNRELMSKEKNNNTAL